MVDRRCGSQKFLETLAWIDQLILRMGFYYGSGYNSFGVIIRWFRGFYSLGNGFLNIDAEALPNFLVSFISYYQVSHSPYSFNICFNSLGEIHASTTCFYFHKNSKLLHITLSHSPYSYDTCFNSLGEIHAQLLAYLYKYSKHLYLIVLYLIVLYLMVLYLNAYIHDCVILKCVMLVSG